MKALALGLALGFLCANLVAEETVELVTATPLPGAQVAAKLSDASSLEISLNHRLLDRNANVVMAVKGVSPLAALDALGHALNCWYVPQTNGGHLLTQSSQLPSSGALKALTRDTTMSDRMDLEMRMRDLMKPWLSDGAGISQVDGRWSAVLDSEGQAHFLALLSLIEKGQPQIPVGIPLTGVKAAKRPEKSQKIATGVPLAELVVSLHKQWGLNLTLAPDLHQRVIRSSTPLQSVSEFEQALAPLTLSWRNNIGFIGRTSATLSEHPASRRRLAWIPLPELPQNQDGTLLVASLQTQILPAAWSNPGWGMVWQGDRKALLIVADPPTINAVLEEIDRLQQGWN